MTSRTESFMKRFKTQKTERHNVSNWKLMNRTPSNRNNLPCYSPANKKLKQRCQKIYLKPKQDYLIKCLNHPLKKATFQSKQSLNQAYCQQCSIKFVKCNMRMLRITQKSLCIRAMYQTEMERLISYQQNIKQLIDKYFEEEKQVLRINFIQAKSSNQNKLKIPQFKIEQLSHKQFEIKLKQMFGSIKNKQVEFILQNQQNVQENIDSCKQRKITLYDGDGQYISISKDKENSNDWNTLTNKQSFRQQKQKKLIILEPQRLTCFR